MKTLSLSVLFVMLLIAALAIVMSPEIPPDSSANEVPEPAAVVTPDPRLVDRENARKVVNEYLSYAVTGKSRELQSRIVRNLDPIEPEPVANSSDPLTPRRETVNLKPVDESMYVILSNDVPSLVRDLEFEVTSLEPTCSDKLCIVSAELLSKVNGKQLFHEYRLRRTDAGWKIYRVDM